jgi:hypothetical protein
MSRWMVYIRGLCDPVVITDDHFVRFESVIIVTSTGIPVSMVCEGARQLTVVPVSKKF